MNSCVLKIVVVKIISGLKMLSYFFKTFHLGNEKLFNVFIPLPYSIIFWIAFTVSDIENSSSSSSILNSMNEFSESLFIIIDEEFLFETTLKKISCEVKLPCLFGSHHQNIQVLNFYFMNIMGFKRVINRIQISDNFLLDHSHSKITFIIWLMLSSSLLFPLFRNIKNFGVFITNLLIFFKFRIDHINWFNSFISSTFRCKMRSH